MSNDHKLPLKKYAFMFILFLLITVFTIYFVYKIFGERNALSGFSEISSGTWIKLAMLMILLTLFDGFRFFTVVKSLKIDLSYGYVLRQSIMGVFMSNVTPFLAGGSVAQIYFFTKKGVYTGDAIAATSVKSLIASTFFMISVPLVLLSNQSIVAQVATNSYYRIILIIVIALYLMLIYLAYRVIKRPELIDKYSLKFTGFLYKKGFIDKEKMNRWNERIIQEVGIFCSHILRFFRSGKKNIVIVFLVTIVYYLILFSFSVVIIRDLGYEYSAIGIISLQMIANFIMYFAFTPGAAGIAEGGYALLFSAILSSQDVLTVMFLWRTFSVYIIAFIGLGLFFREIRMASKPEYFDPLLHQPLDKVDK